MRGTHPGVYIVPEGVTVRRVCPDGVIPPGTYVRLGDTAPSTWLLKNADTGRRHLTDEFEAKKLKWAERRPNTKGKQNG